MGMCSVPIKRKAIGYCPKSVGSAAANPGSEPKISPVTPAAIQANSSNVVGFKIQGPGDMNESTVGQQLGEPQLSLDFVKSDKLKKYKYKYKYPDPGKRKRDDGEDGGADDMHMQQKALPGEQYRGGAAMRVPPYKKKPKLDGPMQNRHVSQIMQKATPGDQYATSSTTDNPTKQKEAASASATSSALSYVSSSAVSVSNFLRQNAGVIPPEYQSYLQNVVKVSDMVARNAGTMAGGMALLDKANPFVEGMISKGRELLAKVPSLNLPDPEISKNLEKFLSYVMKKRFFKVPTDSTPGKFPVEPNVNFEETPSSNVVSTVGQEGQQPEGPYDQQEKAMAGGDPNRLDPITPATGSRQTSATANSLVSTKILKDAVDHTLKTKGTEAVYGNARERANMGKGALNGYEFEGPYDYPVYPGGKPDETLTLMGAWRTNNGHDSSLWFSKKTAKGADAKRNKYFKYSTKKGGRWRKMSKDQMVNVFQKGGQSDNRFYGTRTGIKFRDFLGRTMSHKDKDVMLAKIGNAKVVNSEHGNTSQGRNKYVDANKKVIATPEDKPSAATIGSLQQGPKEGSANIDLGETTNLGSLVNYGDNRHVESHPDEFGDLVYDQLAEAHHLAPSATPRFDANAINFGNPGTSLVQNAIEGLQNAGQYIGQTGIQVGGLLGGVALNLLNRNPGGGLPALGYDGMAGMPALPNHWDEL